LVRDIKPILCQRSAAVVKVPRRVDAATSATHVGDTATSATPSKKDKPSGNRSCTSAIQEVASRVSVRSTTRHHNIPRNTLKRRVLRKNKQVHGSDKGLFHCSDDLHDLLAFCDDAMGRQQHAKYEFKLLLLERETYRNVTPVPNMVPVSSIRSLNNDKLLM